MCEPLGLKKYDQVVLQVRECTGCLFTKGSFIILWFLNHVFSKKEPGLLRMTFSKHGAVLHLLSAFKWPFVVSNVRYYKWFAKSVKSTVSKTVEHFCPASKTEPDHLKLKKNAKHIYSQNIFICGSGMTWLFYSITETLKGQSVCEISSDIGSAIGDKFSRRLRFILIRQALLNVWEQYS